MLRISFNTNRAPSIKPSHKTDMHVGECSLWSSSQHLTIHPKFQTLAKRENPVEEPAAAAATVLPLPPNLSDDIVIRIEIQDAELKKETDLAPSTKEKI
jgi:hypothetical protein